MDTIGPHWTRKPYSAKRTNAYLDNFWVIFSSLVPDLRNFTVGSAVVFIGLVSRAELDGSAGTVLSFDEPSSRIAVKVDDTGECVRVLAKNLKKSSLSS